jgi:hypothetical protein
MHANNSRRVTNYSTRELPYRTFVPDTQVTVPNTRITVPNAKERRTSVLQNSTMYVVLCYCHLSKEVFDHCSRCVRVIPKNIPWLTTNVSLFATNVPLFLTNVPLFFMTVPLQLFTRSVTVFRYNRSQVRSNGVLYPLLQSQVFGRRGSVSNQVNRVPSRSNRSNKVV